MTAVAVLGAGAGGLAAAVELTSCGHHIQVWNRNPATVRACRDGSIRHRGVLGDGVTTVALVTTDLGEVLAGADVAMVCLPALAHARLFAELADLGWEGPVVLNPGHTGGALHLRQTFRARQRCPPPVAELSTLTYVARRQPDGAVHVTGRAHRLRCGMLPGGDAAVTAAVQLYPMVTRASDVLESSLSNVNLVLHPPGAVVSAAWVEATGGDFTFYVDAMTPGVARLIDRLDGERRAVAAAFGHRLPILAAEMSMLGTAAAAPAEAGDTRQAIRGGAANRGIKGPDSLQHRYYMEDFPYGVVPFLALATVAGIAVPIARSLLTIAEAVVGTDLTRTGLNAGALGIAGIDLPGLLRLVRP